MDLKKAVPPYHPVFFIYLVSTTFKDPKLQLIGEPTYIFFMGPYSVYCGTFICAVSFAAKPARKHKKQFVKLKDALLGIC